MEPINLRSFRRKANQNKAAFRRFLGKLEKTPPRGLDNLAAKINDEVWLETDCLSCANCCKSMSPTFTGSDVKRIAAHLDMTPKAFTEKWLEYDKKDNDWINKNRPCQFLDLSTNKCSIYAVRPDDCAGFPHLRKRKMTEYMHVHKQNIEYCPATYKMVEKMMAVV